MINAEREIDAMMLNEPEWFERLLRGYHLLLGAEPASWWRRSAFADVAGWADCIRASVRATARRAHVAPEWLARSVEHLPQTRAQILRDAEVLVGES